MILKLILYINLNANKVTFILGQSSVTVQECWRGFWLGIDSDPGGFMGGECSQQWTMEGWTSMQQVRSHSWPVTASYSLETAESSSDKMFFRSIWHKVLCSCLQMYTSEWSDSDPNEGGIWEEQGQDLGRDSRTINLRCTFMSRMVDLFDCSLYCTFTVCRLTPSTWNVRSIAGYGQI